MLRRWRAEWLVPVAFLLAACGGGEEAGQTTANPCNPCAANPCNPCAAAGPAIDASKVKQPADVTLNTGGRSEEELIAMGAELWNDKSLSSTGATACSTCHVNNYAMINATFAEPYPHYVKMAKDRAGLDQVTAAEMVQLCMVIPMQAEPLAWDAVELAALASYVESIQEGFEPSSAANPCNPCAANPCNPCAANPCNPCAANPCNPCATNP